MTCGQSQWLHGYFDGELDAARAAEFEAHLEGCAACTEALAAQNGLRNALAGVDLYARAPAALRARLRAESSLPRAAPRRTPWRTLSAAASLILVVSGLWAVPAWRAQVAERETLRQVVDAHVRSLQWTHLTDVASTDRHTVKPWFAGKLDFAPEVDDLAADGYPLVGGRLDVVTGRPVAALVYARQKHVINVFVWPAETSDEVLRSGSERGYIWTRWARHGLRFWAISDVTAADLAEFSRRLSLVSR